MKLRRLIKAKSDAYWYEVEYALLGTFGLVHTEIREEKCNTTEMRMTSGHQAEIWSISSNEWKAIAVDDYKEAIKTWKNKKVIVRKANQPI